MNQQSGSLNPQTKPAAPTLSPARKAASRRSGVAGAVGVATLLGIGQAGLRAQAYDVPNGSFESPVPPLGYPVDTRIDAWQESPQPAWYDPAAFGGLAWDQLSGVFPNPPPESVAKHIDNMAGSQAAYLFAVAGVGLFQHYGSQGWNDPAPTHALDVTYQAGMGYQLSVGVIGGGGMAEGATLQIGLYYLDGGNNPVMVGSRDITYSAAAFPSTTHFTDYDVTVPAVQAGDPWAGQKLGVSLMATSMGAGYWDLDHVRLSAIPEPGSVALLGLGLGGLWFVRRPRTGQS
jgi:hypothetical protein